MTLTKIGFCHHRYKTIAQIFRVTLSVHVNINELDLSTCMCLYLYLLISQSVNLPTVVLYYGTDKSMWLATRHVCVCTGTLTAKLLLFVVQGTATYKENGQNLLVIVFGYL